MSTSRLTWLVAFRAKGGRMRLAGTAIGVALGIALLLLIIGAYNGLQDRTERSTWTQIGAAAESASTTAHPLSDNEVLAMSKSDVFHGEFITGVVVAATPSSTIAIPGVAKAPMPGEFYASPALAKLVEQYPADELADRYGALVGTITEAGIPSPESLVVVSGASVEELDERLNIGGAHRVTEFVGYAYASRAYQLIAIVGGLAVLFPVVIFIGVVTRLGQAARSERLASLRLMGATPGRVASMTAIETGVTALVGALAGILVYRLAIPIAALVPIEGGQFFPSDLKVSGAAIVSLVVAVTLLAALVAYVSARRAGIGPLGGSREIREKRPRAASLLVLGFGVALFGATALAMRANVYFPFMDSALIIGFITIALGLVLAGPVLTSWLSTWSAKRARTASGVIALGRISQHPRSVFRAVSGLVIAVFMVTVFATATTTEQLDRVVDAPPSERMPLTALRVDLDPVPSGELTPEQRAEHLHVALASVREVPGVTLAAPVGYYPDHGPLLLAADAAMLGVEVPPGAEYVAVPDQYFSNFTIEGLPNDVVAVNAGELDDEMTQARFVVVNTDGTAAAIERARTVINAVWVQQYRPAMTRAEDAGSSQLTWASQYAGLANTGIVLATLISAVSLSISTIAGVLDRRRVLGILRLTGMPPATLRRALTLETAVPVVSTFALCVGLGIATAWALVVGPSGGGRSIAWPAPSFYWTLALCLALAAVAVLATFRTARKNTEIEHTRFE